MCQSILFIGNEFKPNECHFNQVQQATNQAINLTMNHHQLTANISSYDQDDSRDDSTRFTNNSGYLDASHANNQEEDDGDAGGGGDPSASSSHRQYFIRSSFNASIRTRRSRRSSRRILRRSGGRNTSTPWRHVRFQPVPQAIDISITSSNGFEHQESSSASSMQENLHEPVSSLADGNDLGASNRHHRLKTKVQQQLTRFCRKSRMQFTGVRPKFSAKPLQHLPGHIKSSLGKIKMKTFNNLASQLQHTLTNHHHQQQPITQSQNSCQLANNGNATQTKLTLPIQRTFHLRNSAASAKHQITLSINNQKVISPADLEALNSRVGFGSLKMSEQHQEDDGWGSDFDESQSTTGAETNSLNSTGATSGVQGAGSYLLEIGKSSCDTRAICDVIQDQGISGQFKRLQDVSCIDYPPESATMGRYAGRQAQSNQQQQQVEEAACKDDKLELIRASLTNGQEEAATSEITEKKQQQPDGLHETNKPATIANDTQATISPSCSELPELDNDDDDAAEEEAELRSLEARQNFKQVRDKLKLILEQRLASYERDLKTPKPPSAGSSPERSPLGNKPVLGSSAAPISANTITATATAPKPPPPPPLPRKPSEAEIVAGLNNNNIHQVVSQRPTVHVNHDHFDCQSNCSEASSLSSGGLDSNHSGSQDSGHSTQHSADDGGRSTRTSRTAKLLHHKQQQQTSSGCSSVSPSSSSPVLVVANCVSVGATGAAAAAAKSQAPLPSTAATTRYPLDEATRMRLLEQQRQMSLKLKQKPRRRTAKRALNLECSSMSAGSSSSSASPPSSASSACNGSLDNQSISTTSGETADTCSYNHHHQLLGVANSMAGAHQNRLHQHDLHHQRLNLNDEIRKFHLNRNSKNQNSFTRQLSMVCLRQLEQRDDHDQEPGASIAYEAPSNDPETRFPRRQTSTSALQQDSNQQHQRRRDEPGGISAGGSNQVAPSAKSALSLRELIKEVIDNCEKPGKLSKLTRNILTRSDSLSSSQDEGAGQEGPEISSASDQDKP